MSLPDRAIPLYPKYMKQYTATLPSRKERRGYHNDAWMNCSALCGAVMRRADSGSCGRCQEVSYCSKECQRTHWKKAHKRECRPPGEIGSPSLAMKLTERAITLPKIVDFLSFQAILTLDLLDDPTNAARFAIHVQCKMVAMTMEDLQSMPSGHDPDSRAQVVLSVSSFSRVPLDELPRGIQKSVNSSIENVRKTMGDDTTVEALGGVIVTFVLTDANDETGQSGGGPDFAWNRTGVTLAAPIWTEHLNHIRFTQSMLLPAIFAGVVDSPASFLQKALNNYIRMDHGNKLGLRRYLSTA